MGLKTTTIYMKSQFWSVYITGAASEHPPTRWWRLGCALHRENQIIMILDIKWPVGDTNHNPNRSYYHRNYAKFKKSFDIHLVSSD